MEQKPSKPLWLELLGAGVMAAIVSTSVTVYTNFNGFRQARDQRSLEEIVGPVVMHLRRTEAVSNRYGKGVDQLVRDARILQESNEQVRSLLLQKTYLLPSDLQESAYCLVSHYDIWLSEFAAKMEQKYGDIHSYPLSDRFDIGMIPDDPALNQKCGRGFPEWAVKKFETEFDRLRENLYGL